MSLPASGCFLDAQFRQSGFDGLGHATERFHLLDMRPGARFMMAWVSASTKNDPAQGSITLQMPVSSCRNNWVLRGNARREIGRQRNRFIQ